MNSIQSSLVRFMLRRSNIWNKPLNEVRKTMEGIKSNGMPKGIEILRQTMNGVSYEVFRHPSGKKGKVILYFHGGGFCLGIFPANREFAARICSMTETDVYMPDYRLAPEYPFPAALEDAIAAYRGIVGNGFNGKDVIIMGDSSGCALAVSALLALKQSSIEMPCALNFITPVFDLAGKGDSFTSKAAKDPFKLVDPLGIAKIYVAANNPTSPAISPLYGELDGLPPVLIHAAEHDVFLSDSTRFAEKAENAGVKVDIRVWRKMWHIFHMQAPFVPESKKALDEICLIVKSMV
ncbi:MAG TPA: alpha/beta hydrolase [Anaerovoracaceae bacterium]|nr:alpha/beta hydrolase [Anaerovoracaceae bacterium]HYE68334.1 alpha/beta hydrolase [Anaerovoracaceae bacterium]